jgi:hypothetical protein
MTMTRRVRTGWLTAGLAVAIAAPPTHGYAQGSQKPIAAPEKAVPPERNPPGDIPDTQAFVRYDSPLGFSVEVPEGWARTDLPDGVRFADKYDTVEVTVRDAAQAPTAASAAKDVVPALEQGGRAVRVGSVKDVSLPAGRAVRIAYASNSEPNPVTDKRIRLEDERYLFFKDGKLATMHLAAPYGADNVDDWRMMAQSFAWR